MGQLLWSVMELVEVGLRKSIQFAYGNALKSFMNRISDNRRDKKRE